jgi:hypothetical protein
LKRERVALPEMDSVVVRSRDQAHAAGDRAKSRMPQEASHVVSNIIGPDIQPKEAVGRMTELTPKKVFVQGEKSDSALPVQQGDVIIFDTELAPLPANFPERNPPGAKV